MKTLRLLITGILPALFLCTINPLSDNGGTTEIPNAKIVGYLYKPSAAIFNRDSIPVADAAVTLHTLRMPARTVITDSHGFFMFDSVDTGRSWIEGNVHDTLGSVSVCDVTLNDTLAPLHVLLHRMGRIRGRIVIDTTGINLDSIFKTTLITIKEIEMQLNVTGNGFFETRPIPPFENYTILVSNKLFPWVCRMFKAGVKENETTILDNTNTSPRFTHDASAMRDTVTLNYEYRDTVHAVDPDNDSIRFIIERGPQGMVLSDSIITWTPRMPCPHMGKVHVTVEVQDDRGGFDTLSWIITVRNRSGDPNR